MCYKTWVYQCDTEHSKEYRIYLNQRNLSTLQKQCPQETDDLITSGDGNTVHFNSPRYGCTKSNNKPFNYRKREFCLYNISIPECTSGMVVVRSSGELQSLQERDEESGRCRDYVQFYSDQFTSQEYCGRELTDLELLIPSHQFMAVLWTDLVINAPGFQLSTTCAPMNTTAY